MKLSLAKYVIINHGKQDKKDVDLVKEKENHKTYIKEESMLWLIQRSLTVQPGSHRIQRQVSQ